MGYCTDHTIRHTDDDNLGKDKLLEELKTYTLYDKFYDNGDEITLDDAKWYEHKENMIVISKKYPNTVFTLDGVGEEALDIWREYYKNGKTIRHVAEIKWPDFDETKLKD